MTFVPIVAIVMSASGDNLSQDDKVSTIDTAILLSSWGV
jgi:hypothetical protein